MIILLFLWKINSKIKILEINILVLFTAELEGFCFSQHFLMKTIWCNAYLHPVITGIPTILGASSDSQGLQLTPGSQGLVGKTFL